MSDDEPVKDPWDGSYQGDPPPDTSYRGSEQPAYGAPGGDDPGRAVVKKNHPARYVLPILLGVGILLFVGFAALVVGLVTGVGGGGAVDDAVEVGVPGGDPVVVEEGAAFGFDGLDIDEGWSVGRERFGGLTVTGLRVTATEEGPLRNGIGSVLIFGFYDATEEVAEITCSGTEVEVGASSLMDCFSADTVPRGYDEIRVVGYF